MKLPFQECPVFTLLLAQGGEFAFVVFQAAAGAHVFSGQTGSLLLVAHDRLLPRYAHLGKLDLPEISEPQDAPVVIAGFGRYGQIVARMMLAQGIGCTVLDHDAEMIEAARSFGYRVLYGDASRLDLLRTAGAASAQVLVVAVDDVAQSLAIVDPAQEREQRAQQRPPGWDSRSGRLTKPPIAEITQGLVNFIF